MDQELDVRKIEPKFKHSSIFNLFDELPEGNSLTITNDHDPIPLYYQMKVERGNVFTWEYLENGPEVWRVKITSSAPSDENIEEKEERKGARFFGADSCRI